MKDKYIYALLWASTIVTAAILIFILGFVVLKGSSALSIEFLIDIPREGGEEGGIFPAILGTFYLVAVALVVAVPLGVGGALYLVEFQKENIITKIIRFGADTLNAVPSIIFGLFGFAFLVYYLKLGVCILSGGITLAFMVLPTILRTSEEALRAVPNWDKEGSYALGATKLQTIKNIVLPQSLSGIITGIVLSIGRAAGETAPIIFTAAILNPVLPESVFDPTMSLPSHLYTLVSESTPEKLTNAYGTALVLIILVLITTYSAMLFRKHFTRHVRR
ncbi:MAG: phosphate ABC transporter permease PstA [Methanomicrobia archaeon]|nr:phosphate ABC transporter permease PstA [Methanomicrobia archaeon]RLF97052.1 MAG: phosphate ABC transporter permease PtsA [Thermococci archaeon]